MSLAAVYYFLSTDGISSLWSNSSPFRRPPPANFPSELDKLPAQPSESVTLTPVPYLQLPPEYTAKSKDQELCEQFYTGSYLSYIATHQQPYCKAGSAGAFHCFTAQRLPAPWKSDWKSDPMCVAQGVAFAPTMPASSSSISDTEFELQCQPRNFTDERLASEQASKHLEGVPELTDLGIYWSDTGPGATLRTWRFEDGGDASGCTKENSNNEWILLARREPNKNLWHKLMEVWQARHTIDALKMAVNPATGKPWLTAAEADLVRVVFDDDREEPLDPLWTIVTGNKPVRKSSLQPGTCFGNVIIPLAGSSSPFWTALLERVYHETCHTQTLMTTFVNRVFDFYGITPRPATDIHADPTITIIDRVHNRKFRGLDSWVSNLTERYPNSKINVFDFGTMSVEEQLRVVQATDVLVGHHGAAMTHVMFLPPEAADVEILPPFFPMRGFRSVARMRGVTHFASRCMWEQEWDHVVNGKPLPNDWNPPQSEAGWQEREWTYMLDEDFIGLVDAAVRNQQNRLND